MSPDRAEKIVRQAIKNPTPPPQHATNLDRKREIESTHFHHAFSGAGITAALSALPYSHLHGAGIDLVLAIMAVFLMVYFPAMKIQRVHFSRRHAVVATSEMEMLATRSREANNLTRRIWEDGHLKPLKEAVTVLNQAHDVNFTADEKGRVKYNGDVLDTTGILTVIKQ